MRLQGAMRESQAPERWCWAEERPGASREAWASPSGKAAPDRPCLSCQPGALALPHERCEDGAPPARGRECGAHSGHPGRPSGHSLGRRQARTGHGEQHATSSVACASSRAHTGDCVRAGTARGEEAREPPTTRQGPHAESEGAEESARGKATATRRRPEGAGPEPVESRQQRSPAHAPAVHGWMPGELETWDQMLHGSLLEMDHRG
jgi:hypothetical protein